MPLTRSRRALWMTGLAALVVLRSAVFVFSAGSQFDSDQAVTGLMAKHLSELRAFPVFWYGQTYMLGVEAWLAAPVMAVLGATVTALKLPLLAINVAIALLLFGTLVDDGGLEPARAAFATLFFALAAPMTAAHYVTANGGNVEPCLYVLLLWRLRRRPVWFGIVLGIGFLNREFTIYGAAALLLLEAARRTLWTREALRRWGLAFATAAGVWVAILILRHYSSAAGPGTSTADLASSLAANNVQQVLERICLNPHAIASGLRQLVTAHVPEIFGLEPQPLTDFGIESTVRQGLRGAAWLSVIVFGLPLASLLNPRSWRRRADLVPRTSDRGPGTSDSGPQTSDPGLRTSDVGPRTSNLRPRRLRLSHDGGAALARRLSRRALRPHRLLHDALRTAVAARRRRARRRVLAGQPFTSTRDHLDDVHGGHLRALARRARAADRRVRDAPAGAAEGGSDPRARRPRRALRVFRLLDRVLRHLHDARAHRRRLRRNRQSPHAQSSRGRAPRRGDPHRPAALPRRNTTDPCLLGLRYLERLRRADGSGTKATKSTKLTKQSHMRSLRPR